MANPASSTQQQSGGESPGIAALPNPTPEQSLREQLADAKDYTAILEGRIKAANEDRKALAEERDDYKAQIAEIEKNPFLFALNSMDAGAVMADAGEKLQALSAVVRRREAKGTFSMKITVKPFKGDALIFMPEVKITEPKPEPAQSVFYAGEDGELSRNDPRQKEFGFGNRGRRDEA